MFNVSGFCPKCGAPIYVPSVWMGITPPPSSYSCNCIPEQRTITTTNIIIPESNYYEDLSDNSSTIREEIEKLFARGGVSTRYLTMSEIITEVIDIMEKKYGR